MPLVSPRWTPHAVTAAAILLCVGLLAGIGLQSPYRATPTVTTPYQAEPTRPTAPSTTIVVPFQLPTYPPGPTLPLHASPPADLARATPIRAVTAPAAATTTVAPAAARRTTTTRIARPPTAPADLPTTTASTVDRATTTTGPTTTMPATTTTTATAATTVTLPIVPPGP